VEDCVSCIRVCGTGNVAVGTVKEQRARASSLVTGGSRHGGSGVGGVEVHSGERRMRYVPPAYLLHPHVWAGTLFSKDT